MAKKAEKRERAMKVVVVVEGVGLSQGRNVGDQTALSS
jgi:hypothetical protein